jgi:hypothetical protein
LGRSRIRTRKFFGKIFRLVEPDIPGHISPCTKSPMILSKRATISKKTWGTCYDCRYLVLLDFWYTFLGLQAARIITNNFKGCMKILRSHTTCNLWFIANRQLPQVRPGGARSTKPVRLARQTCCIVAFCNSIAFLQ